jgi:hypothetical protein
MMDYRGLVGGTALLVAFLMTAAAAQAFEDSKYPNLKGAWNRAYPGGPRYDQTKPPRRGQETPLTPEFQARFEANLKDQEAGGQGDFPTWSCISPGMPMMMTAYEALEFVVTPETTYVLIDHINETHRRIFTDGRDFSPTADPAWVGYSVGKWTDVDGDGTYDVLEVETRNFRGPRAYDNTGAMLHPNNQSVIKERIWLDKEDILHDEITVIDDALTRPWTVMKLYKREANQRWFWREDVCPEGNLLVGIGAEIYYLGPDGYLMPAKKGQRPPDLKYFRQTNNQSK